LCDDLGEFQFDIQHDYFEMLGFGRCIDETLTRFRTFIREYEPGTLIPSQGVK
jgi:hypothetical protein